MALDCKIDSTQKGLPSPRKPGRPTDSTFNVAESLIAASADLVASKGFQSMTLKEVGARGQSNTAMVAYYFGNKQGLCQAVIEQQYAKVHRLMTDAQMESRNPTEFWHIMTEKFLDHASKDEACHRIHLWAQLEGGAIADQIAHGMWNPVFTTLTHWLRRLRPDLDAVEIEARCSLYCVGVSQFANWSWTFSKSIHMKSESHAINESYRNMLKKNLENILFN